MSYTPQEFYRFIEASTGRKFTTNQKREILIQDIIRLTRNDIKLTEIDIYTKIYKIWKLPDEDIIKRFNKWFKADL